MLFNSLHYLVFLPVVTILYFAIPYAWRWLLLLVASYYFYMCWKPEYAILMVISTSVAYVTGLALGKERPVQTRKAILAGCIVVLLGILFTFKYFNFAFHTLRAISVKLGLALDIPYLNVLLPVGISFYTFQKISYVVDVYHGKVKPERHLGIFAVYSCFFAQLVAGPIERPKHLLHQFYERHNFSYERATSGLWLILWGLFKKVAVADRLSVMVNSVYNDPHSYSGLPLIVATVFFAFQIYCDFSGYSDIAVGSARLLGFDLIINFRQPYLSQSIGEFWRRWHISLSSWFRDYVYIPLGGNRVSRWRWYYNLFLTFLVSGLWHGANWTFVIWGALHGSYMLVDIHAEKGRARLQERLDGNVLGGLLACSNIALTFILVVFAWIFFRANSLSDAWFIVNHLFSGASDWVDLGMVSLQFRGMGLNFLELCYSLGLVALVMGYDLIDSRAPFWESLQRRPRYVRWATCYAVLLLVLFFNSYNTAQNFIYFQF